MQFQESDAQGDTVCMVWVTVPSADAADAVTKAVLDARTAACVNRLPGVTSTYVWQGERVVDQELLLCIKTTHALLERLETAVKAAHSYDVPEMLATPVLAGHAPYLAWVNAAVAP